MAEYKKFRKIGVLTSGGDAPGMNAALRAVTRRARTYGIDVVGVKGGYLGLIEGGNSSLDNKSVSNIINKGGTVIYTDRCDEFKTDEGMQKAVDYCNRNEIDAIVAIGGDGTFAGAAALTRHGIPTIGIPGTIDNDIPATDYTIGFDTALNTTISMIDNLRDTCESHARCNVVEVMGRNCGQIALYSAIAAGAVDVLVPEIAYDANAIVDDLMRLRNNGKRGMIVVVSEGVFNPDGSKFAPTLTKLIDTRTKEANNYIEPKYACLAHVVRGGSPSLRDRVVASQMGIAAVDWLTEGKSNLVTCEQGGKIVAEDIEYVFRTTRVYSGKMTLESLADECDEEEIARIKACCDARVAENIRLAKIVASIKG